MLCTGVCKTIRDRHHQEVASCLVPWGPRKNAHTFFMAPINLTTHQ